MGLPRRVFYTSRNDKSCRLVQVCHGERSCVSWPSVGKLSSRMALVPRGQLGSCHYERSEVIQNKCCLQGDCFHHATSVARGRLTFRLRKNILLGFAMTRFSDKNCDKCRTGKEIASVTTFLRNDKSCRLVRLQ